ncbi:MAG: YgiQ family radical SAM protein [Candidatus Aminicenantes bacterium]|nr:YgiQ family radical SAM protein [Candidatus Aminicenantes bacterium]
MISTFGRDFDVILVGGEPYADHPLSGVGVIARVLDAQGYRVGVVGRPDWTRDHDFMRLGRPRLFFGVTAGSIDSLLVNTTPLKRRRSKDAHAPRASGIPDRAVLVYCAKLKELFPGSPLVIGGIEASLRRFAHYDYWEDRVRRSLLLDSRADILVYGPGELQVVEIARRFAEGRGFDGIPGTCVVRHEVPAGFREIPSFEEASADPDMFCRAQRAFSNRAGLAQKHANRFVIQYPMPIYATKDLDGIYGLPFSRMIPKDFPEFQMARFSVVTHRGCIGDCSFCALSLHQGDRIVSRSEESILDEIRGLTRHPDFKGFIDDLGGPTANMYGMDCSPGCADGDCLDCRRLDRSHGRLIRLMRKARAVPGVKKVFVRSGIRYDLAMDSPEYLEELSAHHLSGLLKIAPEHVAPAVLRAMNKDRGSLKEFRRLFRRINRGRQQHLAYYFMVAHPGSGDKEARELGRVLRALEKEGDRPAEGIQVFTPTPMTRSTCMYHTGMDPETGKPVFVPRSYEEKKVQRRAALGE